MIISQLIGGLGNQMFQYALGRAISLERDDSLQLDISGFTNYQLHQGFELNRIFKCRTEIASRDNVSNILGWQSQYFIRRILSRSNMSAFRSKNLVIEPHFNYWNGIKKMPHNCYLSGYWQSEKYFLDYAKQIRKDFTFMRSMNVKNTRLVNQISQENAVSLHVRRGDYVNNPKTTATHGVCSLDYYRDAISYIADNVSQPKFYIFSDDMDWVKSNLKMEFSHQYVDYNKGAESYNDMRLMSLCKHNIIANSSFSWWGAWLNGNPHKIVIAPKNWFSVSSDTTDLIPNSWVRL